MVSYRLWVGEPVIDPIPRYAELAGETLTFKDLARERINELGSWEQANEFDNLDIHAAVKVHQWALEQSERILGRMSSLGLTAEILHEAYMWRLNGRPGSRWRH